jgi:hypothetical protein
MDERCWDCPWFDNERKTCCRKPPRFCDVDAASQMQLTREMVDVDGAEAGLSPVPASRGRL